MNKSFTDTDERLIFNGAEIYFKGQFPDSMPILDEDIYAQNGDKHSRFGVAIIEGDTLKFGTYIDGKLWTTGLTWELDGEPCYDLINLTNRYRLEYYDGLTDKLIVAYEGDDLDALYNRSIHHLKEDRYGVEIDRAKPNPEPTIIKYRGITAEISPCRRGYKCIVTDSLGNELDWFVRADSMLEAVAKAERSFDNAIRYFRGFIVISDFFDRLEELL